MYRPSNYLIVLVLLAGCRAPTAVWDGQVHQWGTMREVLGLGQSQARVDLASVVHRPHVYGVGAVANLDGEITIDNSRPHVARVSSDGTTQIVTNSTHDQATLLAVAYVPQWNDMIISDPVPRDKLDSIVREFAVASGIDVDRPFPFLIVGQMSIEGHVINGSCPRAAAKRGVSGLEPLRFSVVDQEATAVGFYAKHAAGSLVHHGSASHIHVIIEGDRPISGHVDSISLFSGAVLRLPVRKK